MLVEAPLFVQLLSPFAGSTTFNIPRPNPAFRGRRSFRGVRYSRMGTPFTLQFRIGPCDACSWLFGATTVAADRKHPAGIEAPPPGDSVNCMGGVLPIEVITVPEIRRVFSVDRSQLPQG